MLGTSCNYQFEIMSLKSSLAIMMVQKGDGRFFGKDSDDSRMQCLKSILGMEKVNLIKRSTSYTNLSIEFVLRFMKFILI